MQNGACCRQLQQAKTAAVNGEGSQQDGPGTCDTTHSVQQAEAAEVKDEEAQQVEPRIGDIAEPLQHTEGVEVKSEGTQQNEPGTFDAANPVQQAERSSVQGEGLQSDGLRTCDVAEPIQEAQRAEIKDEEVQQNESIGICDVAEPPQSSEVEAGLGVNLSELCAEELSSPREKVAVESEAAKHDKFGSSDLADPVHSTEAETGLEQDGLTVCDLADPAQHAEAATGYNIKLPEMNAEGLLLQQDVVVDLIATHHDNNNTSQLETTDHSASDVLADHAIHGAVTELGLTVDKPLEACDSIPDDSAVEITDFSSGEFVHHLVDSPVVITHSVVGELKAEQVVDGDTSEMLAIESNNCRMPQGTVDDVSFNLVPVKPGSDIEDAASEMDFAAEILTTCNRDASITEQAGTELGGMEKLPVCTELDASNIGMTVCRDVERKADSDPLDSNQCDLDNTACEMPIAMMENDVKIASLVIAAQYDEHTESESDNGAFCAELTCDLHANAEVAGDVTTENMLSEASADTVESDGSEYNAVTSGKETEVIDECNKPSSYPEVRYAGTIDTEALADGSNDAASTEIIANKTCKHEALADVVETAELEYVTDKFDDDNKDLEYEFHTPRSQFEENVHVESSVGTISVEASYRVDGAEISESTTDSDLPCKAAQEAEMHCTEGEKQSNTENSVLGHDQELLKQAETVAEPDVMPKQINDVEPMQETLELANTIEPAVDDDGEILRQLDSVDPMVEGVDPMVEGDAGLVKQCDNDEPVIGEAGVKAKSSGSVESVLECNEELQKQSETVEYDVGHLQKQCETARSVSEHEEGFMEQFETVEQVVEYSKELPKQHDTDELAVKEDEELLKLSIDADSVLERYTEFLKQREIVKQVVESHGESLQQSDVDNSVMENDENILKLSEDHAAALACKTEELKQPQHDETMGLEILIADEVTELTCADGLTDHTEDASVSLQPAEECSAYVSALANVSSQVLPAATSDLSPDLCDKHCQHDVIAVPSAVNANAEAQLDGQVPDSNVEVCIPTVEATALAGIESEAQATLCDMKLDMKFENNADACSGESLTLSSIVAASSEDGFHCTGVVADTDVASSPLHSENTVDKDARSENTVESVVASSLLIRDTLEDVSCPEDAAQKEIVISAADESTPLSAPCPEDVELSAVNEAGSFENTVVGEAVISTANTDLALPSPEHNLEMLSGDKAICRNSLEPMVQDEEVIKPMLDEDVALHALSSKDTDQIDVAVLTTADNGTPTDAVSSECSVQNEDVTHMVENNAVLHASSREDTTPSGATTSPAHEDTYALIEASENTDQRDVPISTDEKDVPGHSERSESTEHDEYLSSTVDKITAVRSSTDKITAVRSSTQSLTESEALILTDAEESDVNSKSGENPAQSVVTVSMTDNDEAATVSGSGFGGTLEGGEVIFIADEDVTVSTKCCRGADDNITECKNATSVPADINTVSQVDNTVTYAAEQFDSSHISNSSIEEGQFDDVESDDSTELATLTNSHRQVSYMSSALRSGLSVGRSTSVVPSVGRNLPAARSSLFTLSPVGASNSRHSMDIGNSLSPAGTQNSRCPVGTFAVASHRMTSAPVWQMPGCSPLLSSPVGQTISAAGRPGARPRFPQSPIISLPGAGSQIHANSPRTSLLVVGTVSSSGEKLRKRKRSTDDADVSLKRSLVADFVGNTTTGVDHPCDSVPAECAVISSGCGTDDVITSDVATGVDTSAQTAVASEKREGQSGSYIETVLSLPCDDQSITVDALNIKNMQSSEITPNVSDHSKGNVLAETQSLVVNSMPFCEEYTTNAHSDLVDNDSLKLDAKLLEKLRTVESVDLGFMQVEAEAFVSTAEEAEEGTRTEVVTGSDEPASDIQTLVVDVAKTACSADETVELEATHSGYADEVDHSSSDPVSLVDQHTSLCIEQQQGELSKLEPASEVEPCDSTIALNVITTSSFDPSSFTTHVDTEPVTDVPQNDKELTTESMSTDVESLPVDAVSSVLVENSACIADSGQISPTPVFCTQDDVSSSKNATGPPLSDAADPTAAFSVTDLFASQFVSKATSVDICASQATVGSDVGGMWSSQCISQVTKDEVCTSQNQADNDSDVHGLHLFLESSQEPNTLHASFRSQYVSQETNNEGCISCSQTSDADPLHLYLEPSQEPSSLGALKHKKSYYGNDVNEDDLPTDVENNQETASESELLLELRERGVSSQSTAGGLDQSIETAVGDDEENATLEVGEDNLCVLMNGNVLPHAVREEDCQHNSEHDTPLQDCQQSAVTNEQITALKAACSPGTKDQIFHAFQQDQYQFETEQDTSLDGGQRNAGAKEQITSGEDATSLETKGLVDSVRIESNMIDRSCESTPISSYYNADELIAEERCIPSVIVNEGNNNDTSERFGISDDVIDKIDLNGGARGAENITEPHASARSPVKHEADIVATDVARENDNETTENDDLDVTESIDSSTDKDVTQLSKKAAECSPLKPNVLIVVAAAIDDDSGDDRNDIDGIAEDVPGTGTDLDYFAPADKTDNGSDVTDTISNVDISADNDIDNNDVDGVTEDIPAIGTDHDYCSTAAKTSDDYDDDDGDEDDSSDRSNSASDIGEDVDLKRPAEKTANYHPSAVAAVDSNDSSDDDDDSDDDSNPYNDAGNCSDVTESMSDIDSNVGHLSDVVDSNSMNTLEPGDPGSSNDSVRTMASLQLLTKPEASVYGLLPQDLLVGKCCLLSV